MATATEEFDQLDPIPVSDPHWYDWGDTDEHAVCEFCGGSGRRQLWKAGETYINPYIPSDHWRMSPTPISSVVGVLGKVLSMNDRIYNVGDHVWVALPSILWNKYDLHRGVIEEVYETAHGVKFGVMLDGSKISRGITIVHIVGFAYRKNSMNDPWGEAERLNHGES